MSPLTEYLRSSPLIFSHSPVYDDKGRQLPFHESPPQRRQRHAFVKSLQCQRNVATWIHNHAHSPSDSQSSSHSTSSSESSSPRTPASPLNTPHTHTSQQHKQQQAALDAELAKLALATAAAQSVAPPQHRQSRNYKNLHLPNTPNHIPRYQAQTRAPQQPRAKAPITTRGIFDSSPYTYSFSYPPAEDDLLDHGEPYLFYSSTTSKRPSTPPTLVAGIGEFPCPAPRSSGLPLTSQLQPPSSSSSPRTLTFSKPTTTTPTTPLKPRQIGDH